MSPTLPPLAFVDLETTGGAATDDRITEVAVVTLDGDRVERWSRLVNPQTRIPPFIERLTGIRQSMVDEAPTFAEIADELRARLDGRLFVAHNARFDYGFLKNEFRRAGFSFRATVLCTVRLSRRLYPQHTRHGLDQLIARHGLQVAERHRALGDAQAICDFWRLVYGEFGSERIGALVRELTARPALPPGIDPDCLDEIPDGCGVYLFYGEDDVPLYVGKSRHLRSRVLSHFASDHGAAKESAIARQLRRIDWIVCAGEVEALLNEARLVKALQPAHNRRLRRNRRECTWQLVDQGDGLLQPQLRLTGALTPAGTSDDLYGLFASERAARACLQEIAREHELCQAMLGLENVAAGKPCFARQLERCRGACVGAEPLLQHGIRLLEALGRLKLAAWPFSGPAGLREGGVVHVIDGWRYVGTAGDEAELASLLSAEPEPFDRDTYRILVRHRARLEPLPSAQR